MVIGVSGNCRTTGLDDLNALADVYEHHKVWFHVDACHGGNLLFSKRLKQSMLKGYELKVAGNLLVKGFVIRGNPVDAGVQETLLGHLRLSLLI